jgi:hypothetical protein
MREATQQCANSWMMMEYRSGSPAEKCQRLLDENLKQTHFTPSCSDQIMRAINPALRLAQNGADTPDNMRT